MVEFGGFGFTLNIAVGSFAMIIGRTDGSSIDHNIDVVVTTTSRDCILRGALVSLVFLVWNYITVAIHDKGNNGTARNLTNRVAVAATVCHASKDGLLTRIHAVFVIEFIQGCFPFAQEVFTIGDFLYKWNLATCTHLIARSSTAKIEFEIKTIAGSNNDRFPTAGATINNAAATARNVIPNYRRAATDAGDTIAAHASSVGQFVIEEHIAFVHDAFLLGAAATRGTWVVDF